MIIANGEGNGTKTFHETNSRVSSANRKLCSADTGNEHIETLTEGAEKRTRG